MTKNVDSQASNTVLLNSSSEHNTCSSWRSSIASEWNARHSTDIKNTSTLFPPAMNPFGEDEVLSMTEVLLTGRLTMGIEVEKAEKKFAQIVGVPYAIMASEGVDPAWFGLGVLLHRQFQTWNGPIKVVSILSTVIFPKNAHFPIDASPIYDGPPHLASESYAYSKRSLAQLTQWYRKQHKCDFVSILPGNFFGAYGDFNPNTAPLVNALIAKMESQKEHNPTAPLTMMGTGTPLRQIMFAYDLAQIVIWAMENYNANEPLIVAGEEFSISQIAQLVSEQ
ncbi:unnamed protein product, partial [Rotaria sp. Silwood1]